MRRVARILRDGHPAAALDRREADRPVIEVAREYDTDHARTVRERRAPKERIDGGTKTVFARTVGETKESVLDE